MITVFADKYLRNIEYYLPEEVDLQLYDPSEGLPGKQEEADALLIRTVHPINEKTLSELPPSIEFIATASAGTDHVDRDLLAREDIAFADAAGCNARSVAEYVATVLLVWADLNAVDLKKKTTGIVGVGHVGSEVIKLLEKLDLQTIAYDPPKEQRQEDFASATLDQLLSADILSFHLPLSKEGEYPTHHWLDREKLNRHTYDLLINTARGGVVYEKALLEAHSQGTVRDFIIDVWENEPIFNDFIAQNAFIKTPHIAGYSRQAKNRASWQVAKALCNHFSLEAPDSLETEGKSVVDPPLPSKATPTLTEILSTLHPVYEYQKKLMKLAGRIPREKGKAFNRLRAQHPLRNEFGHIRLPVELIKQYPVLDAFGFSDKKNHS